MEEEEAEEEKENEEKAGAEAEGIQIDSSNHNIIFKRSHKKKDTSTGILSGVKQLVTKISLTIDFQVQIASWKCHVILATNVRNDMLLQH